MKKIVSAVLVVLLVISLAACGEKAGANPIPDVFGVHYEDAISVLEADGFAVSAIEASVGSFSDKLLYPLERVDKGAVFKIDDYIIDNNGNLNKNYDVFYKDGLISADKSVVIYYAEEDYVLVKNETPATTPTTEQPVETTVPTTEPPVETTVPATEPPVETTAPTTAPEKDNSIGADFKDAMDSYEEFFDEYVAIMKKYQANPMDFSILADYAKYMAQYADMMQKFEKWESEDLNDAELAYYLDVQNRITKKLLEVAQ